jgi:hypothetical protein
MQLLPEGQAVMGVLPYVGWLALLFIYPVLLLQLLGSLSLDFE